MISNPDAGGGSGDWTPPGNGDDDPGDRPGSPAGSAPPGSPPRIGPPPPARYEAPTPVAPHGSPGFPAPTRRAPDGLALTALAFAVASPLPWCNLLALIFSVVALVRARREGRSRRLAVAALVVAIAWIPVLVAQDRFWLHVGYGPPPGSAAPAQQHVLPTDVPPAAAGARGVARNATVRP